MKKIFIILMLMVNVVYAGDLTIKNGNVYQDYYAKGNVRPEIDKLQFYLFKSIFNHKHIFEVIDLHIYIMKELYPEIKFYSSGHTVSLDTTLYHSPDLFLGYGIEWYVSYSSKTCNKSDFKKGLIKKCQTVVYIIDKPADEQVAYFRIEVITLKNENGKITVTDRKISLNEVFTQYGN